VALDPDTGKLVWYYQHMNRDVLGSGLGLRAIVDNAAHQW